MAARLAEGHDGKLNPIPPFEAGVFGPAGGLRSTIKDMALFVKAVMPGSRSSLEPSAQLLLQTLRPAPAAGGQQALGWEVLPAREGDYVSKDGLTAGQCASAVYDPAKRTGVVVSILALHRQNAEVGWRHHEVRRHWLGSSRAVGTSDLPSTPPNFI